MEVLRVMDSNEDWREMLSNEPYNIIIKDYDDYILLKYNQLSSDFSLPIVRECRGAIFYKRADGLYDCVCRAFDKFMNYGQDGADTIDWSSAIVEEKVDGSLIKLFYHNGKWHVATNGTVDAFCAEATTKKSYGDIFIEALGNLKRAQELFNFLDKDYTYMFELVSPETQLVVSYPETKLYYLGRRNIITMKEDKVELPYAKYFDILMPKQYSLSSIDECLAYVKTMTKNEEGFVVRDKYFRRIKIKSPEYLMAFGMNNNNKITEKRIINMMKNNTIDDFIAYCPQHRAKIDNMLSRIFTLCELYDYYWETVQIEFSYASRKELAFYIKDYQTKDFLFHKYDNPSLKSIDYVLSKPTKTILRFMEKFNI